MNIYSAEQIRAWDAFTIQHEPVTSIDLMERAAEACVSWIIAENLGKHAFKIFCGKGNNGGDGLAISRLLWSKGITSEVFILEFGKLGTEDFQANLHRLHALPIPIHFVQSEEHFPLLHPDDIVVDALFGSGLNKPVQGLAEALIKHLNKSGNTILAIDLPSGLFPDTSSKGSLAIEADHTLTFQTYKLALLVAENAAFIGEVHLLDIGLHPHFLSTENNKSLIDPNLVGQLFQARNRFAHKGNFGHALIVGGSYGKIGAVHLAVTACLRSGAGLVTAFTPACGYEILQMSAPEAMVLTDENEYKLTQVPAGLEKFSVLGIGPGIGTSAATQKMLQQLLSLYQQPMVLDADALNCLAQNKNGLHQLPPNSVFTPHPKEFERLFGACANEFERIELASQKAAELSVIIVLKGHHTLVALPGGKFYFNSTGNAGMAKGGSGDVLTGIITAFCAQGYAPAHAAILGVYIHGLAGDLAASALSKEAMIATDIITFLSQAFVQLNRLKRR